MSCNCELQKSEKFVHNFLKLCTEPKEENFHEQLLVLTLSYCVEHFERPEEALQFLQKIPPQFLRGHAIEEFNRLSWLMVEAIEKNEDSDDYEEENDNNL